MMKFLLGAMATTALILSGFFIGQSYVVHPAAAPIAGAFNTTGGGTYNLAATITSNQTTITLSSFLEPTSNIPYTMSYLNSSIEYATIGPQTSQSEFISFTGITQNGDGSATLTGVQRGLDRSYPYTASSTLALPHAGQTRFILSNPPQVYNSYGALVNANTWSGVNTFSSTSPPTYDADPVWANFSTQVFADVAYVNSVVAGGAANASETVKGIVQLATAAQAALGTSIGSTAARLALPASLATSTPYNSGSNVVPVTGTNEKLSQLFLDLTQPFVYSGPVTFNGATTTNFSIGNYLKWNGITYTINGTQGASSTILQTNGNGGLTWEPYGLNIGTTTASTSPSFQNTTSPELTLTSTTIPANTLGNNNSLVWDVPISALNCSGSTNGCSIEVKIKYGGTTVFDDTFGTASSFSGLIGRIRFRLVGNGATNSQYADTGFLANVHATTFAALSGFNDYTTTNASVDSTVNQSLIMTVIINSGASMTTSMAIGAGTVTVSK